MKRDLVREILQRTVATEGGLRTTLSRIKKRHDLKSIEQAACFYIKKKKLSINVSSIIDDVTRQAVKEAPVPSHSRPVASTSPAKAPKPRATKAPKIRWLPAAQYGTSTRLADFYPYLFLFENALRKKIDAVMRKDHGANWWETRIKADLGDVYKYSKDEQARQSKLPIVGKSLNLEPLECVTVGHLDQMVQRYNPLFIPSVFPTLHFFTGHLVIVKHVRNALAHMSPAVTVKDIRNAKNEIDILLQHMASL